MPHPQRAGTVLLALLISLVVAPTSLALAETSPPPISEGSNAVGACLDAEQVWLLVTDIEGDVLANQCVGTPASGEEALMAAGVDIERADGFICSLSGHPDPCPATFTGSYWNYHHATAGSPWAFSEEGAETYAPEPGAIEAWCYNKPDVESCEPPLLTIMSGGEEVLVPGADAADYFDPAVTGTSSESVAQSETDPADAGTPWALVGTGAIVVVGAVTFLLWRRRASTDGTQVGGR